MEWWQIYLLTRLDDFKSLTIFLLIITGTTVLFTVPYLFTHYRYGSDDKGVILAKKILKLFIPFAALFSFFCVMIPTDKDIAVILAGHWATHNEQMQKLPSNVLKTLNAVLEKAQDKLHEGDAK